MSNYSFLDRLLTLSKDNRGRDPSKQFPVSFNSSMVCTIKKHIGHNKNVHGKPSPTVFY